MKLHHLSAGNRFGRENILVPCQFLPDQIYQIGFNVGKRLQIALSTFGTVLSNILLDITSIDWFIFCNQFFVLGVTLNYRHSAPQNGLYSILMVMSMPVFNSKYNMNKAMKQFMAARDAAWEKYWAANERTNEALWADLRAAQADYRAAVEAEKSGGDTTAGE